MVSEAGTSHDWNRHGPGGRGRDKDAKHQPCALDSIVLPASGQAVSQVINSAT